MAIWIWNRGTMTKTMSHSKAADWPVLKGQPFMKGHPHFEKGRQKILFWNNATHLVGGKWTAVEWVYDQTPGWCDK